MLETRPLARRAALFPAPIAEFDLPASRTGQCAGWRLSRVLGEGRWTRVYQARPKSLPAEGPADYALKMLRREFQHQPLALSALKREAVVAREVTHPNLAAVLSAACDRAPYHLVLPYLEGVTLRTLLADRQQRFRLPSAAALWTVRQTAAALQELHAHEWLHGDVKPENILVSPAGHATLCDLGFARRLDGAECLSRESLQGTPAYLAPEAFTSHGRFTAASDVYSLGCVLFESLTGQPPFRAIDAAHLATAHLQQVPPNVRTLVPELPVEFARLVAKMLAKDPLRRPDMAEVLAKLVELEIDAITI